MHGIMFWKDGQAWVHHEANSPTHQHSQFEIKSTGCSPVYTWQDGRCSKEFLNSLPKPESHLRLSTGYGCATLFWLLKNKPEMLQEYNKCGSPMDFFVAMLCNNQVVTTSDQLAASWGYFNTVEKQWNLEQMKASGFPTEMLPQILPSDAEAGVLHTNWFHIPSGTPIGVSLGDLQCSVRSTLVNPDTDAVLNVSTSAQMAFVKKSTFTPQNQQVLF